MKFSVERDNLLHALGHANRIVAKSDAIPIMATALFEATGDRISIAATNTEIVARTGCRGDIAVEGRAAIRVGLLADILRKLPAGTALRFERDETTGQRAMLYRRSRATLPTLSPEAFAVFEIGADAVVMEVAAPDLARLLSVPAWVAKADHAYSFACGIHLHEAEGSIIGVAADGAVLSRVSASREGACVLPPVTVPLRSCAEIVKLAQAVGGGTVTLRATDRALSVEADGTVLTTKLIECQFPDYRRIIPDDPQPCAAVAYGDLSAALDRVRLLADDNYQTVLFEAANGVLTIAARSSTGGEISEQIEVEGDQARFAVDALNAVDADLIHLAGGHLGAPVVMRPAAGGSALAMLMPLRV